MAATYDYPEVPNLVASIFVRIAGGCPYQREQVKELGRHARRLAYAAQKLQMSADAGDASECWGIVEEVRGIAERIATVRAETNQHAAEHGCMKAKTSGAGI